MSKSSDGGKSRIIFPELTDNVRRSHMVKQNGQIIAASYDRTSIYAIDRLNHVKVHPLPSDFLLGISYSDSPAFPDFKILVTAADYLYLIAEDQNTDERVILRTINLETWQEITRTSENLISLSYWEGNNSLVTSSNGVNAKIWRVDLNNLATLIFLPIISKYDSIKGK
jgi:hypothetical protein